MSVRSEIAAAGRQLLADRLVVGTAGNISARDGEGRVAVTPTGVPYTDLAPDDIGVHSLDGAQVAGPYQPTSELPLHLAVYRVRPDVRAVVHTHPVAGTALSCLVDEVPAVHYYVAMVGGAVRVAPYAEYGTDALAAGTVAALGGNQACLLGNHGMVTVGGSLAEAYQRTVYLEWVCEVALAVLGAGRPPRLLDRAQLDAVAARLASYGQP